jgi:glutamyl-tRNA synthetase
VAAYRTAGILPAALVNYLAMLGWNPGDEDEPVRLDDMVGRFALEDVSRNPAIFDRDKLEWLNGVYVRELPQDRFVDEVQPLVEAELGRSLDGDETATLRAIGPMIQERTRLLPEATTQVRFLFVDELEYDPDSWNQVMTNDEVPAVLTEAARRLGEIDPFTTAAIEASLRAMLEDLGLGARKGFQPIRVAVSGSTVSPPLFESIEALGRERTLQRLADARSRLA